jgi:hypothetical protein
MEIRIMVKENVKYLGGKVSSNLATDQILLMRVRCHLELIYTV